MKKNLDKYVALFAVIVLIFSAVWWVKWRRQEEPPVEKKMMDTIDYHMKQAQEHADIAREFLNKADEYGEVYNNPVIDSIERSELGAKIWDDAIRKADSIRQRTP